MRIHKGNHIIIHDADYYPKKDDMFAKLVKTYGASSNNLVNVIFIDLTTWYCYFKDNIYRIKA
jgi:hypothetical protein